MTTPNTSSPSPCYNDNSEMLTKGGEMPKKKPRDGAKKLTHSQTNFTLEYVVDFNGKQAAIRAGYSPRTAEAQASRLLRNVKVKKKIKELCAAFQKDRYDLKAKIIRELELLAFAKIPNIAISYTDESGFQSTTFLEVDEWPEAEKAALQQIQTEKKRLNGRLVEYKTKVKFHDKIKALELLAKHIGMEADDHEEDQNQNFHGFKVIQYKDEVSA